MLFGLMTRVVRICYCSLLVLVMTGCVYSLHPYNASTRETLRIQALTPENYVVRLDESPNYPVASDGRVSFEVPPLPRGCAVYLFGVVKVADHKSEDIRAIHILKGERVVHRLSLNQISKLPVGADKAHELRLE
jgi:hypothetical protein